MLMKRLFLLVWLLISIAASATSVWPQEDQIRGGWLESRSRLERRTKPVTPPTPKPVRQTKTEPTSPIAKPELEGAHGLGIGYTLFKKNADGEFVRVGTQEVFKSGDSARLLVETNLDGYLYIFSREGDQPPMLLYPNSQVQNGKNFVPAHQAFWLPEEGELEFDSIKNGPAKETLTLVFSETLLPDLAAANSLEGTPVDLAQYNEVARATEVRQVGNLKIGLRLTTEEGTRKVRIRKTVPPPAYILVNRDAKESRIVANIQLTHN
jgi:hypothetical protein